MLGYCMFCAMFCDSKYSCGIWCCVQLYCVVLCSVVLCCVVFSCVVLCCIMSCHIVFCCTLCYTTQNIGKLESMSKKWQWPKHVKKNGNGLI
jgi:hypothetical protein